MLIKCLSDLRDISELRDLLKNLAVEKLQYILMAKILRLEVLCPGFKAYCNINE